MANLSRKIRNNRDSKDGSKPEVSLDNNFFSKYGKAFIEGLPKYAQLRESLRTAIEEGYWRPGEKLPPETVIAETTPFSLGTVQKALKALVDEGIVERRHGSGTFVSAGKSQMYNVWHFRFSDRDEKCCLPVYPKVVAKKVISSRAPWASLINPDSDQIIQIDRIIRIGDQFSIYSKFFLSAKKFKGFLSKSPEDLKSVNFKTIIRNEYNVPIRFLNHTIHMIQQFPREITKAIHVPRNTGGMLLKLVAFSVRKKPVYYQEIYIPPNDLRLHISDSAFIPECWM